jgi:hypothetical protein
MEEFFMEGNGSFFSELAEAKRAFPKIHRSRTVEVRTKSGGKYAFAYAPLESILAAVEPELNKRGFVLFQVEEHEGDHSYVETFLAKGSEAISGKTKIIVTESGPQAYGSALTLTDRL